MSKYRHVEPIALPEDEVDLNPLIDIIVMLIVFFVTTGRLSKEVRAEQITVPPTRTAAKIDIPPQWGLLIVNVFGNTQTKEGVPRNEIRVVENRYISEGQDNYDGYVKFRDMLDRTYVQADKYPDAKNPALMLPKIIIELRCDANTQYRVVQEVQQILTDTIDPRNKMLAREVPFEQLRPFVVINFTTRLPQKGG